MTMGRRRTEDSTKLGICIIAPCQESASHRPGMSPTLELEVSCGVRVRRTKHGMQKWAADDIFIKSPSSPGALHLIRNTCQPM